MLNKVQVIGNLGRDAEIKYTAGGSAVLKCSVAATEKWTGKDGQRQERTEWFNVEYWGKGAEAVSEYMVKGKTVYVEGRLQTDEYEKDGKKQRTTKVRADRVVLLGGSSERREGAPSSPTSHSEPPTDDEIPF